MKPWWKRYRSLPRDACVRSTSKASRAAHRVCLPPGRAPIASLLSLWVIALNVIAASTPSSANSSAARPTRVLQKAWRSQPASEILFMDWQQAFLSSSASLLLSAFFLDLVIGDPAWFPHPVVLMGKLISMGDRFLWTG